MFKDIRGRELHLGDFILYNFDVILPEYAYGILLSANKLVLVTGGISEIRKDVYCSLVENPTDDELLIKNKIIRNYNLLNNQKLKDSVNKVKLGVNYSRGDVLSDDKSDYLYLGFIELRDSLDDSKSFSGHAYLPISPLLDDYEETLLSDTLDKFSNSYVLIDTPDGIYGSMSGIYSLKLQKRKSSRFNSVLCHIDISCLSNITLCLINNLNGFYDKRCLNLIFKD